MVNHFAFISYRLKDASEIMNFKSTNITLCVTFRYTFPDQGNESRACVTFKHIFDDEGSE